MGVPGPPPADNKRRRNASDISPQQSVTDDGERSGEPLGGVWSRPVMDWWDAWRRAPQAKLFLDTDWQRLRMLAPLVEQYWILPDKNIMAEIRQNESLLGATHVDRLRGRIKVDRRSADDTQRSAGVTALDEYRRNLAG